MITTTSPTTIWLATSDHYVQGVNLAPECPPGTTVQSITSVTLTDQQRGGGTIDLPTPPTLTGTVMGIMLNGASLTVGHHYTLKVVFSCGPTAPALTATVTVGVSKTPPG